MKAYVLSSGSKGNSTVLITDKVKILIDIGTTCAYVENSLRDKNIEPNEITHILITHDHVDHIKGLKVFLKKYRPTVHVTEKLKTLFEETIGNYDYEVFQDNMCIIEDLTINTIKTSHDATDSVGFIIKNNKSSLVYITDTGYLNSKYDEILSNRTVYIFESNHDVKMLREGPYPYHLQQRVISDKGHLSNKQASTYLCKYIGKDTKKIVFAHISEHNNTEEKVIDAFKQELSKNNIKFNNIEIARQHGCTEVIEI